MHELMFWEAVRRAHDEEMSNNPLVICMGEDIGVAGGTYKATQGLYDKYGPARVIDTPISETAIAGSGMGAAQQQGVQHQPARRASERGRVFEVGDHRRADDSQEEAQCASAAGADLLSATRREGGRVQAAE